MSVCKCRSRYLAEGDVIEGSARVDQPPPRRRVYEESTESRQQRQQSRVPRDIYTGVAMIRQHDWSLTLARGSGQKRTVNRIPSATWHHHDSANRFDRQRVSRRLTVLREERLGGQGLLALPVRVRNVPTVCQHQQGQKQMGRGVSHSH